MRVNVSAYASNVLVNLQTGLGTGVGSLANIQSVIGGNRSGGYNILVGNGGKYLQAARAGATCSSRVPRPARGSAATVMMF